MKKLLKTTTAVTLAAALALPAPYAVLADGKKGHDDWKKNVQSYDDDDRDDDDHKKHWKYGKHIDRNVLKDIQASFWAKQNIEFMFSLGLISGYPDGTFQPNKPVTNAEAVVMTINMLGLQDEAKALENAKLSFKDANAIPTYARGSVALAVEKGIIDDGGVFQPNKGATRMDIVSMLVLSLGEEGIAGMEAMSDAEVSFTDVTNLTDEERQMLAYAVLKQLVKGYDDKSFKPNKPVTRAEFATMIVSVLQKYFDLKDDVRFEYKVKGEVTGVNATAKTITVSHKSNTNGTVQTTFNVSDSARIYRDNKAVALAEIKSTDKVELVVDQNNKVVFVAAKSVVEETNYLVGEVTGVSADRTLSIIIGGMLNVSLKVASDAVIEINGKPATFEQLSVKDKIKFSINAAGQIHIVKATSTNVVVPTLPAELQNVREFSLSAKSGNQEVSAAFDVTSTSANSTVVLKNGTTTTTLTGAEAQNYIKQWVTALNKEVISQSELNQLVLAKLGVASGAAATVDIELETTDRKLQLDYAAEADGDVTAKLDLNNNGAVVTALNTKQAAKETLELKLNATNLSVVASKKVENNTVAVESTLIKDGTTEIYVGTEFSTKVVDTFKQYGLKIN